LCTEAQNVGYIFRFDTLPIASPALVLLFLKLLQRKQSKLPKAIGKLHIISEVSIKLILK
jgi:hypothetical protein